MIDIRKLQTRVGVPVDGVAGVGTWTAVFRKCGASAERAGDLATAATRWFPDYGILESELRLAHLLAQMMHETQSFFYTEEVWGPTAAQRGYEGRRDLGNTQPGDGLRYKGRGPFQLTGRGNYRIFGRRIGIDLESNPTIAAVPSIGLHIALEYWVDRKLNALADRDDLDAITRRINGGTNGLADRRAQLATVRGWLL